MRLEATAEEAKGMSALAERTRNTAWHLADFGETNLACQLNALADALDAKDKEIAALRAAVLALPEHKHSTGPGGYVCLFLATGGESDCNCGADAANVALAAARLIAGEGEK